jgi:hypothetical protein
MSVWHCDRHDRIVRCPLQGTRQPARVPPGAPAGAATPGPLWSARRPGKTTGGEGMISIITRGPARSGSTPNGRAGDVRTLAAPQAAWAEPAGRDAAMFRLARVGPGRVVCGHT